ncbi:UNVERIFIED_CONTAM: hypothetical protein K2H54_027516 [Gekko kuhli]
MKEPPAPCPARSGPRAKDHCDYLLDSIDAQLNQLQARRPSAEIKDSGNNEMASFNGLKGNSSPADLSECSMDRNVNTSSEKVLDPLREKCTWRLAHLLDLEGTAENQSQSDSVCTEDFADKFKEGLVEPLLNSDGEEDVFAGRILSYGFGPLECTARDQAENVGPSQFWGDPEAASDSSSINAIRQQSLEQLEQALPLGSEKPPSLVCQNRVGSLESLGGKISSFCKESSEGTTNAKTGSSMWGRILFPRPLGLEEKLVGLEMGISGETAIMGLQQRRDGLEQLRDSHQNSNSPLLIEDLCSAQSLQTAQRATVRKSMLNAEASSRRVGQSCQEEGQCHCQRGLSSITCLCPLVLASSGRVRGGLISPLCLCPLIACDASKRQRPTPPRLGTSTGVANAPGDFQQPLGPYSKGSAKHNRTTNACTERHREALELMACHGTEESHLLQEDVGRDSGPSDTDTEEEEEKEESELLCQSSCHRRWRREEPSGWKRAKGGAGGSWKVLLATADSLKARNLQDLKLEEEKRFRKKSQIQKADATLCKTLQEKKRVALELEALHKTLEESQKEVKRLDLCLKQHHTKAEGARADLVFLECKRDACLRELPELEKALSVLRQQCGQYGEVSQLVMEREELKSQVHHQKLQLRNCEAELAAVQEAAGPRAEHLQEVARAAGELDRRTQQLELRISALQKILSEKELEMFRLHKAISALEAGKESWDSAVENLRQEHKRQVEKLQVEAMQEKERELVRLQEEKQQLVREVTERTEQAKTEALQEQAATFREELENLCKTLQDQDAELVRQQEAIQQQARKLKQEATEMMQNVLLQEQKKWEADTKMALRMQRETLEDQCWKMRAELQEALEKERRNCLALQVKTDDLHKRIQVLEARVQLLQGEKSTALEELRALLQEEKAEALSRLRKELEQERIQERNRTRARIQQMEADQRLLQAEQRRASIWEQGTQTHTEWTDGSLAREVTSVCQRLQDLLPKQAGKSSVSRMTLGSSAFLSSSHALQVLQEVSEATQHYLRDLKQESETLKHNILQSQREKEQQLRQQQEQLHLKSQLNLEALKDHIVQEHMKDIAALQHSWLEKSTGETHVLRKQLQEKDEELRAIQRNMACWKEERASKLAHKFQTQPKEDLEQCLAKDKSRDICRNLKTTESEIRFPCTSVAPSLSHHNSSTPKRLHCLQSQIQASRVGNTLHSGGSLEDLRSLRGDLGTAHRSKTIRKHVAGVSEQTVSSLLCRDTWLQISRPLSSPGEASGTRTVLEGV